MILPIRCFTCNRVICDGKIFIFEESRDNFISKDNLQIKLANLIKYFDLFVKENGLELHSNHLVHTPRKLKNDKLQEYHNLIFNIENGNKDEISKSADFDLLNLLSLDKICCRRMFLGYVNMIDKII